VQPHRRCPCHRESPTLGKKRRTTGPKSMANSKPKVGLYQKVAVKRPGARDQDYRNFGPERAIDGTTAKKEKGKFFATKRRVIGEQKKKGGERKVRKSYLSPKKKERVFLQKKEREYYT